MPLAACVGSFGGEVIPGDGAPIEALGAGLHQLRVVFGFPSRGMGASGGRRCGGMCLGWSPMGWHGCAWPSIWG